MSALATKPLRQVADVRELLVNKAAMGNMQAIAAKHMNPERMMKVVANAIRVTPKLAECDPMSMLGALMQCSQLGLEPNTILGHAYLIPFKNNRKNITEVQLIVGYKGLADLARRTGQVRSLHADVVYDDDELWDFEYGSNMVLRHKPGPQQGNKIAAYCHARLEDGGEAFVVLPWEVVMATRDRSQGWLSAKRFNKTKDSPWTVHEDRMAAKTAMRALANRGEMPLSIEFQDAMVVDDAPADFAAFATDPGAGVTIEGTATEHDADGVVTEDEEPEKPKADPKPKDKEKKAEPKKESEPAKSAKDEKPVEKEKPAKSDNDGAPDPHQDTYEKVLSDLSDGAPVDPTLNFHDEALDLMKSESPALHKQLMAEVKEFE